MKPDPEHRGDNADPADERSAGQAVRWLLLAGGLGLLAVIALLFRGAPSAIGVVSGTNTSGTSPVVPRANFKNITQQAGIRFVHQNGAYGEKLLPETMGGGCAFFDFDGDGAQDILFVNSSTWPWHNAGSNSVPALALYRNNGRGEFKEVTAGSGLEGSFYGMGVAVGDYDNDGLPDLFVTAVGGNHLFHNQGGGKFLDITAVAGFAGSAEDWGTSAVWIDYDNDGRLDLFVCNYVRWSRELDLKLDYKLSGIGRAYGPPLNFAGSFPRLYHNEGKGRFTEVSAKAGIKVVNKATGLPLAKSLGVSAVDLDGDGWIDLVVANDTVQNFVFHNERNGTFKEIGEITGTAFDNFGKVRGAMGIDAVRIQEDNSVAISIGNFANEMTAFYVSDRDPMLFSDQAISQGIGTLSRQSLTFGVFFFDYDLDGWLDLLTANGHIEEAIAKVQPNQSYRQPAQLFWNATGPTGKRGFLPVFADAAGEDLFAPMVGRGSAFADIDGDGDLDLLITQVAGVPMLLRNEQQLHHHWARFKLVGTSSNRDAIGAWVKAKVGGRTLWRQVMPARGYLSQSELPVTIGLGEAKQFDEVSIIWPGGQTEKLSQVRIDALNTVVQGRK